MSSSLAEFISWPRNEKRTALFDSSSVSRYSYVMRITVTLHKLPNFLKSVQKGFTDEKFTSSNPISYVLSLNFYVLTPVLSLNWSSSSSPHVSPPTPRAPPEPLQRAGSLIWINIVQFITDGILVVLVARGLDSAGVSQGYNSNSDGREEPSEN